MEKHRKIKFILISLLIAVIVIIAIVVKKAQLQNEIIPGDEAEQVKVEGDNGFYSIKDFNKYNILQGAIGSYLQTQQLEISENMVLTRDEVNSNNQFMIRLQEEKNKVLYSMIDSNYSRTNNITEENISTILQSERLQNWLILEFKEKQGETIDNYLVHIVAKQQAEQGERTKEKMYLVRLDKQNRTYSVEPLSDDNMQIETVQVQENENPIVPNAYNQYVPQTIYTQTIARQYFEYLKNIIVNYPNIAYDKILANEYKEKRFGTIENFERYVNLNKDEISNLELENYKVETENEHTKYIIQDQYKNTYEILENYTMDYVAKLDDYTIPSENVTNKYNKASENEKVALNLDRIVKMINSRDYYGLYNTLDETYRNTNFPTIEEFEQYMKSKFSSYYNYTTKNNIKEKDTYVIDLDIYTQKESIHQTLFRIIMQLRDGLDFKISFNK